MTEKKMEKFEVSQKAVIYDFERKKFLLMKYSGENDKDKSWSFVGGRMESNESPIDGLKREINEELGGIDYEIVQAIDTNASQNTFRVAYLVLYKGGEITLSDEHDEFVWFSKEEIEKEKLFHPGVQQFIGSAIKAIESEEYLNDLKRLQADFENYKKRQLESQKDLRGILTEKLILDIVPVLDNFRSATQHVPPDEKESPWVVGIQYIEKQLETVLTDNGVQMIEVKEGDVFDPSIHEALDTEAKSKEQGESAEEDEKEEHKISKVVQKGYKFGDRVIRPAKVIVK